MDFVIPLNKDNLLQRHSTQYYVKNLVTVNFISQTLDATRKTLEKKGPEFIFDHFDDFFSVIVHGKKLDNALVLRAYDRIMKSTGILVGDLENEMVESKREKNLCMLKMHCYLLSHFMCYLENETYEDDNYNKSTGKKKKQAKSDLRTEWENRREPGLIMLHRLLQLPLGNLWQSNIVEESFIMLVADICYKILEHKKNVREKNDDIIWHILGILIKRYMHGMTCIIKIIQLVQMYDALAQPLASGIVVMVTENNSSSFISELLQEVDRINPSETEAHNIATFIETIASVRPDFLLENLSNILEYLANPCYVMRNCAIEVIGHIIIGCFKDDKLSKDQKEIRDECFEHLLNHRLDINTYVRSKVFQTWQKLISEFAVPMQQLVLILKATIPHLNEKSSIMRKQALQLIRVLLQCNPFSGALDLETISQHRDNAEKKLQELQANIVAESASGDTERLALWEELLPDIHAALKEIIKKDDNTDDDDEMEEINLDEEFELIRQLMINRKITEAVKRLQRVYGETQDTSLDDIDDDTKEDLYLLFLLKIFLDSEQNENGNSKEKYEKAEWKSRKDEVQKYRQTFNMLNNAVEFITEIEQAIPIIEEMLFSATPVVAIESCTLLGTAYQFKIKKADSAVHTALSQVFSREESVRNNVAIMYKDIYLKNDSNSSRQKAISSFNSLMNLLRDLKPGQSPALAQLISLWFSSEDLNEDTVQIMWEKFSFKIPETTILESRCALALLTMIGQNRPKIITSNLNIFIKIGLKEKGKEDFLLVRDTCRALLKIKNEAGDEKKEPIKFQNDHELFEELSVLLIEAFENINEHIFVSFAIDAINVIYHLANQPDQLMKNIILKMLVGSPDADVPISLLAKFLYFIGHVTIAHMVYLDVSVYKELKRRNKLRDTVNNKKNNRNQNNDSTINVSQSTTTRFSSARKARRSVHRKDMSFQDETDKDTLLGAAAHDADAEVIDESLETCVVTGDGFMVQFVPIVLKVCQYPEKYKDKATQVWGVLALSKMMTVSSAFCKQHLQLLVTILDRSKYPEIRSNILVGLSDLIVRFPNDVEPWTAHMYTRLRDEDVRVRTTALRILSNLIKREIIRVKCQISDIALCIVDPDDQIRHIAESFFNELAQKDNILYNTLPDIISKLTSADENINEDDLHNIFKHIIGLLHKEKEIDALIDKICARFKLATTERQWRDLSYCLSLFSLGKKGIVRLTTNLPLLKDQLHNRSVYGALRKIIETARKKADAKDVCAALENEIDRLMDCKEDENQTDNNDPSVDNNQDQDRDSDREAMPPPPEPRKSRSSKRKK
ncbi:condensin complex subunit 1 [Chelonus insularis]|uniref:condensin complex subunit 1 n=1 Tax=Chelonus insularis TaxID=460826 RepID=UPI001588DAEA|nr:condensin complex subunit 1 [Chelonus insularis]